MMWQVHQDGFIIDEARIVGSMVPKRRGGIGLTKPEETRWRVEILWTGPGGDIVYETDTHAAALAFILGVEAALQRTRPPP